MYEILAGSTGNLIEFFIGDTSVVTGAGLTGVVFNSVGLLATAYISDAPSVVPLTLVTMALGTWIDSGFVEISSSLMPGRYQLGVPNALVASVGALNIDLFGANHMLYTAIRIIIRPPIIPALRRNAPFTAMPFVMLSDATRLPAAGLTVVVERMIDAGASVVGTLTNITDKGAGRYTVDGLSADSNGNYITFTCTAFGAIPTIFTMTTVP